MNLIRTSFSSSRPSQSYGTYPIFPAHTRGWRQQMRYAVTPQSSRPTRHNERALTGLTIATHLYTGLSISSTSPYAYRYPSRSPLPPRLRRHVSAGPTTPSPASAKLAQPRPRRHFHPSSAALTSHPCSAWYHQPPSSSKQSSRTRYLLEPAAELCSSVQPNRIPDLSDPESGNPSTSADGAVGVCHIHPWRRRMGTGSRHSSSVSSS